MLYYALVIFDPKDTSSDKQPRGALRSNSCFSFSFFQTSKQNQLREFFLRCPCTCIYKNTAWISVLLLFICYHILFFSDRICKDQIPNMAYISSI